MEHLSIYGYGYWPLVIGNVLFASFIVFMVFRPRTRRDWRSMGALSSFFLALFFEMFGFPLTIYLLSSWLGSRYPVVDPFSHNNGHLLGVFFGNPLLSFLVHPGSDIMLLFALIIIAVGWKKIHKGGGELVTDGIYAYVRHPQYLGFYLIIFSFLLQWPTLLTLLMAPILVVMYSRLAKSEEEKMIEQFGEQYVLYSASTKKFIPYVY
ncbi:MAG: isoprenylcysteine carboxylmethyltransferase family protein [Dethiobacter sp.]|jgi:protein-S-isoprenylcysteine O-methyltransferase Ste14|nr:isoprenylcysteine carboxylmethyltransferase family protein [Dethiobacter sp.]